MQDELARSGANDGDELIIGVRAIAREVFNDRLSPRQVYNLLETDPNWPCFKLLNKWTARRGPMRAEIARRERRQDDAS